MSRWDAVSDLDYEAEGHRLQEQSQVEVRRCQECGRTFQFWPTPNVPDPVTCNTCRAHDLTQGEQLDAALDALLTERTR